MAAPHTIWIESRSEQDARSVLGALADYDSHLHRIDGRFRVEVRVDRELNMLLRGLFPAVELSLAENGIDAVTFRIGRLDYVLRAQAA